MKILKRIFWVVVVIVFFVVVGLHTFVSIKGRDLLVKKLHSIFQSEVSIGRVTTSFPLRLIVKDVEVKNWFKIKKVIAGAGIINVFKKNLILSSLKLEGAEFDLEKRKLGEEIKINPINLDAVTGSGSTEDFFLPQCIILKHLIISGGTFTYTDYTTGETPIKIRIKDLNMQLENFQWPFLDSTLASFKISGRIPWENIKEDGRIEFEGWINFYKKDLRAKLGIKGIDGVYIYPYYSSWVNIDKARVEKARLNFTSNITSLNNDVNAACHLELTEISFKPREEDGKEPRMEKIANVVFGLLKVADQGKIVLDFNIKTKLDNPEFGLGVIQEALKNKIYQSRKNQGSNTLGIIQLPGKIVTNSVISAAELTKSVITGTANIGKEFKKAMGVSFSKGNNNILSNETVIMNQTK